MVAGKIRVLIAEDQQLMVRMLTAFVGEQPDIEVVGEVPDGRQAVEFCRENEPDLVLMDVSMPEMDGLSATRMIRETVPGTAVIMLTAHQDKAYVLQALRVGARGYLHKNCTPEELAGAIRTVRSGAIVISPTIVRDVLADGENNGGPHTPDPGPRLTQREIEVLKALAEGNSNKQIAQNLYISERTVRNHALNIYKKLRVHDRAQAALYAVQHGIVKL